MCGIIGYVGKKNIGSVIIHGLECVEYRGYDSAGISVLDNNKIRTVKSVGKIENLKKKLKKIDLNNSTCGIGHTRWATHGEVSELNAHPQVVNKVSVVHNGIIENYKEIERELKSKYSFKSDTDSERIAALIDSFYDGTNPVEAIDKAIHKLKGSYAIGVIFEGVSKIYGVRKDAPLVLGIGSKEHFIEAMNKKAESLGLKNTHFVNVHGLDEEGHYSSAYGMSVMARELLKHEKILDFTRVYEEYLTKPDGSQIWLVNTNKLVRFYDGVDGLKTGFTDKAGYCLTATGKKNNLRLISVVMGEESIEKRSSDTVKLLNYGFNTFKVNLIKNKSEILGKVNVQKGKKENVDVVLVNDLIELLNASDKPSNYKFKI